MGPPQLDALSSPLTLGIAAGLLLGKPLGITLFSYLSVRTGIATLPSGVRWSHMLGVSILGGIGFTMSLFIAILSFPDAQLLVRSKLGILGGSFLAGLFGLLFLRMLPLQDEGGDHSAGGKEAKAPSP